MKQYSGSVKKHSPTCSYPRQYGYHKTQMPWVAVMERALAEGHYSRPALEKLRLRQKRHIQGPASCGEMVQITLGRKHRPNLFDDTGL